MSWIGEGFSSLKGQWSNLVKNVQVLDDDEADQQGQVTSVEKKNQPGTSENENNDEFPSWIDDPQAAGSFLGQEPAPSTSTPSSPPPSQSKQEKEESKITRGIVNFLQNSILPVTSKDVEVQVDLDAAQQIRSLQEANDRLVQNNDQLTGEVATLSRMVQDLESQVAVSQDENANLSTGLEELDIQHQQAIQSILTVRDDTARQYEVLKAENEALQKKYDELVGRKAEGSKDQDRLNEIIKELEEKNSELQEVMEENNAHKTTIKELKEEVAKCKEYLPPIFEHSEEVEALEHRVRELEADVAVLSEARSNLEVEVSNANRQVQALNDSLRMADAKLRNQENINMELRKMKEEKANWEMHKKEMEKDISLLQKSSQAATTDLEQERQLLIVQVEEARAAETSLKERISQLQGELEVKEDIVKKCATEKSQLKDTVEELMAELEKLQAHTLEQSQNDEAGTELEVREKIEEENKELREQLEVERKKVKELDKLVCTLQEKTTSEAKAHSEQMGQLKALVSSQEEEIDKLRSKSSELAILNDVFKQKEAELKNQLHQKEEDNEAMKAFLENRDESAKRAESERVSEAKRSAELQEQVDKLNCEKEDLEERVRLLTAENGKLAKDLTGLQLEAERLKGECQEMKEAEGWKSRAEGMTQQIDTLTRQLRNLETIEATYNDKCTDYSLLMSKLEQVDKEREELAKVEGSRVKELKCLREEIDTLKSQLEYASQFLKYSERQEAEGQPDSEPSKQATCPNGCTQTMEEINKLAATLLSEQTANKLLRNEVEELREKAVKASNQCTTLTSHLVEVEDRYTEELKASNEKTAELTSLLRQAEERVRSSSNAYTSASIRSNQQVESLSQQVKLLTDHKEKLEGLLSKAEDQAHKQQAAVTNLQAVLQQFQTEKQRDIEFETLKIRQELKASFARNEELKKEMKSLQESFEDTKRALSAASRLKETLDKKSELVNELKTQISELSARLEKEEEKVKAAASNSDNKVDRSLVKNLIVGYINTPQGSKAHALKVLASILDFSKAERQKVGLEPSSTHHQQSLSEAFVKFLEMESQPKSQVLLPLSVPSSGGSSRKGSQGGPPPSLSFLEGQPGPSSDSPHPSVAVGRTPASILKDVLKDRHT